MLHRNPVRQEPQRVEGGQLVEEVCREYGIFDATYCNWKTKYGGMSILDIKRRKGFGAENRRLKKMYAELSLEHHVLNGIIEKKL